MKIRVLAKHEVEKEPFRIWNAFIDLLAMEKFEELSFEQRPAYLVFRYESEVENGGHFQYFENCGAEHLTITVEALGILGATCQQEVLQEAGDLWLSRGRKRNQSAQEFCDTALEGEFETFDSQFHACKPTLQNCLQSYLENHQHTFVHIA